MMDECYQIYDKSNTLRNKLINMLVTLMLLFSATTMYQSLFDKIAINRILGAIIALIAAALFLIKPERKLFISVMFLVFDFVFSVFLTVDISKEINEWIYVFTTIFLITVISQEKNSRSFTWFFIKKKKLINFLIHFECVTLVVLLILGVGLTHKWGEGTYFLGFCNTEHTMGSLCCMLISMILFYCKALKKTSVYYLGLSFIPSYAILQCGARVFLIPMAIMIFLLIRFSVSSKIWRLCIGIVGIAGAGYVMMKSAMIDKFITVLNNPTPASSLASFTSGRSEFWVVDLNYFFSGNVFELLFGRAFANIYDVNYKAVNMSIWCHNDIIYFLVGGGLVGAFIYLYVIKRSFTNIRVNIKSKVSLIMLILYMILPMLLNGFMVLQHFVYSFVILYFTILLEGDREVNEKSRNSDIS